MGMNRTEKRTLIRLLCARVQKDLLKKVAVMPEDWDGHEVRQYIADAFQESVIGDQLVNPKTGRKTARGNKYDRVKAEIGRL